MQIVRRYIPIGIIETIGLREDEFDVTFRMSDDKSTKKVQTLQFAETTGEYFKELKGFWILNMGAASGSIVPELMYTLTVAPGDGLVYAYIDEEADDDSVDAVSFEEYDSEEDCYDDDDGGYDGTIIGRPKKKKAKVPIGFQIPKDDPKPKEEPEPKPTKKRTRNK